MKALTLEDCKRVKITDLWLGLPIFKATDEDAEAINEQKNDPKEIQKKDDALLSAYETATEMGLEPELAKQLTNILSEVVETLPAMYTVPMFLLKVDDERYYSLNDGDLDPEDAVRIDYLEPFSDYYSEGQYRFVIINGKVCIDVDSGEPFERYSKKALDNFVLM